MDRAKEAAATMRLGGGIGYGFSTLRPFGALIKKLESYTTGPVSFMNILDAVCGCVSSAGHRRGAQMAVLLICHPDIERFIHAKQNGTALRNFNLSVAITDAFMKALQSKTPFDLTFEEEVYRTVNPDSLWEMLMRSTWDWADPGVLFIDRINQMNNLWYCETIEATNPCGEQPLPPYGACLLGSFNLVRCLKHTGSKFVFDWDLLKEAIPHVVRAMDNVIDRTLYPLHEQEQEAKEKRRMGLGVTGLANTLEALGFRYGDEGFLDTERAVLSFLRDHTYLASVDLAKEKGSFKKFKKHEYLSGQFIRTLPDNVKDGIEQHGIRNSHLLSIAPTGTISLAAGNVSSGIEPVMEYEYKRDIITPQGKQTFTLSDYGYRELGIRGQRVKELGVDAHVDVLITAQPYVDSAVSKTVNIPKDYDWTAFKDVYLKAYLGGAKGCTTYREGGKRESIFSDINENDSCTIDAEGRKSCE
jgi:ribonucleoside-diphosphate reductase alpha chain